MTADVPDTDQRIADLEAQVRALTHLLEVTNRLNGSLLGASIKVEALLAFIMDAAVEVANAESASVLLWKHSTRELFFAATTTKNDESRALIGKTVPSESIAGTIFREARTVKVNDVQQDARHYARVDEDIQFITRSLMGVPMIAKGHTIGVLEVVNRRSGTWTEQDEQHLKVLAEEAAVAIEVAQLVVALQKANNDLNELDKLKNDFIAIAAHELRTPLGVILGYASFLQEEATNAEYGELASKVMNSALQLRRIIEDMVNLRYLKQKEAELYRENFPLRILLEEIKQEALSLTDASNHHLTVDLPPADILVYVDRTRLTMGLNNLVNNAIRFTPPGGKIQVKWSIHENEARISISDTGIGIEKNDLEKIFEEFYQVEDHMTRKHGGLGIGLSIARALIQAHGGRIWVESAGLNQGSTFILTLPLAK